jgi:hypothetical protein
MKTPDIILPDGTKFDPDNVQPKLIGFHIVHKLTGRILPSTTRQEVYSKAAAIRKMNQVASMYNVMQASLDIWDYELCPIYDIECQKDYIYIEDINDDIL